MKSLIASIMILGLVGMVVGVAVQADETVTATVTPQIISVSVTGGTVDYGILNISESNDTLDGTAVETQTITSGSNVSTNLSLSSADAVGTTVNWDLVSLATGAGSDTFVHYYDIDGTAGSAVWTDFPDDNSYSSTSVTLTEVGGTDNSASLDLKIDMPTSITDTTVHSITITVLVTEAL